jgi:tetratricopeptide (TPR) repeat protein
LPVNKKSDGMKNSTTSGHGWKRGIRPLTLWVIFVLALLGIHTHQQLSEKTHLIFTITMSGQSLFSDTTVKLDGKYFESGNRISIGSHQLIITNPKAESFSTNLFIWYGDHNLGAINLKRAYGNLTITVTPPADWLIIRGADWTATMRNSSGTNATVPTDTYDVEADFPHLQDRHQLPINANVPNSLEIAPRFGTVQLNCNQVDATYQLLDANGQNISSGSMPATIEELPLGRYTALGLHHGHQNQNTIFVNAGQTNTEKINFDYGTVAFETTPPGAAVSTDNGRQFGETPLTANELIPGNWNFTLQRYGFAPVQMSVEVAANQTNFISTNLVSLDYLNSMTEARQYLAVTNLDLAEAAVDRAIQASPLDGEAVALQRKITTLSTIQKAEIFGKQNDYTSGIKLLQSALQLEPDNEQAKQLLADYQQREPAQLEQEKQAAQLNAPRQAFAAALGQSQYAGANAYKPLLLTTSKAARDVGPALNSALTNGPSPWVVTRFDFPLQDIFILEAKQSFFGGLRRCVIIGGQAKTDETQIWFKVLEYETKHTIVAQSLLNISDNVQYNLVIPSAADQNDFRQHWIPDGIQMISDRIHQVTGE